MNAKPQSIPTYRKRVIYLDLLRVISVFAVVWLHVSVQGHWWDSHFGEEWTIRDVYNSCVRWCVPVFVMISGALFLDSKRELNIKLLYTKNVVRIILAFVLWSLIYVLIINEDTKFSRIIAATISGHFHLWFLKMLLGLYIVTPILKVIVSNKQTEKYFIYIAVITCFVTPMLFPTIGFVNSGIRGMIEGWYNTMNIKIALGYTGYFVLGHFLNTYTVNKKISNVIYVFGVASLICVIILTYFYSHFLGKTTELFMEYLTPFTLLEAVAVFLFVKHKCNAIPVKYNSLINNFAKMSFGIYLVHILVMFLLSKIGITSSTFHPSFFIPCFTLFVFIVSYLITRVLYNIPYLNKLVK